MSSDAAGSVLITCRRSICISSLDTSQFYHPCLTNAVPVQALPGCKQAAPGLCLWQSIGIPATTVQEAAKAPWMALQQKSTSLADPLPAESRLCCHSKRLQRAQAPPERGTAS